MEEEEDGDASTPFWLQSRRNNNTYFRRTASLRGRATTIATQIFFAGAATILIVFFILPPFISSLSQFFRPHLVRKTWDYLNIVLVLFAVLCGFLSRNTTTANDETNLDKEEDITKDGVATTTSTPRYWIDDLSGDNFSEKRFSRLKSSSSYPDLRLREYETSDQRWKFYDDTRVTTECRYQASDQIYQKQGADGTLVDRDRRENVNETEKVEKTDDVAEKLQSIPPSPPSVPASKPVKRKIKRVYHDVAPEEEKKEAATTMVYEKKKGGAKKDFLITLKRKKKKKQQQQSIDGLDLLFGSTDPPFAATPPPPPPPPPPFFQTLFSSKKGKTKKTPPPPPEQRFESRASITKALKAPVVTEYVNTGNESPLMSWPPPPPPLPPFKMPVWKFVKRGDYVRMASDISMSSDEPDDDSKAVGEGFCPSPDVDTKADNFIARFRAGLKLEKINSDKRGRSNLGPEPEPEESES